MPHRVIVISPDAKLGANLQDAFKSSGMDVDATIIEEYPSLGTLKSVVVSDPEPVAAFIVGLSNADDACQLIKHLRKYDDAVIVGADLAASPDTILAAMRAGAREFLAPPFEMSYLRDALAKRHAAMAEPTEKGRLSCILPAKAGSGASTLAMHLAAGVARASRSRTLLVDYDFHCGMTAFRLRLQPDFTLLDALSRAGDIGDMWKKVACPSEHFDLLAAPHQDEVVPHETLRDASRIFSSAMEVYPYVFVDMPPGAHKSYREILNLADTIYVVSTPEVVSLHLARRRVDELVSLGVSTGNLRLIVTRAESALAVNAEDIVSVAGIPIHWSIPNSYGLVSEASLRGTLVPDNTQLGRQYAALACEIAGVKLQANSQPARRGWKNFFALQVAKAPSTG